MARPLLIALVVANTHAALTVPRCSTITMRCDGRAVNYRINKQQSRAQIKQTAVGRPARVVGPNARASCKADALMELQDRVANANDREARRVAAAKLAAAKAADVSTPLETAKPKATPQRAKAQQPKAPRRKPQPPAAAAQSLTEDGSVVPTAAPPPVRPTAAPPPVRPTATATGASPARSPFSASLQAQLDAEKEHEAKIRTRLAQLRGKQEQELRRAASELNGFAP